MFYFLHFLDKLLLLFQGYVSRLYASHNIFRSQSLRGRKKIQPVTHPYIQQKPNEHLHCKHEDNISLKTQFLNFHRKYQFRALWPSMEVNSHFIMYLLPKLPLSWWKSSGVSKEAYKSKIVGWRKERKKQIYFSYYFGNLYD